MYISELISQLQDMQKRHGDGEVYYMENFNKDDRLARCRWIHHVSYQAVSGIGCTVALSDTKDGK